MIDTRLLNLKIKVEEEILQSKLWLANKEVFEYTTWKSNPLNEKDRSAMDKVVSAIKIEDEVWMQREQDLISQEMALKMINIRYETLQNMLRAMSNHNAGVDLSLFDKIQEQYLTGLEGL